MIQLKSESELEIMSQGGKILSRIISELSRSVKAGVSTKELDEIAEKLIKKEKVVSAFKDYRGFPGHICISINEEIVHGIPQTERIAKKGDIISTDIGIIYRDYYVDAAFTSPVGEIDASKRELLKVTFQALQKGIKQVKINNRLSDISYAIQRYVEAHKFSIVREFVGHGIGKQLHEDPQIPNFGLPHQGPILKKGMVLAIEPMVNMGSWEVDIADNGWTAITRDRLPSAHFEHTVAVTEEGVRILTA
jgi:methionyl aminopeptidase